MVDKQKASINFIAYSLNHPWVTIGILLLFVILAAVQIPSIKIDTDPENMLSADQIDRVTHNKIKQQFNLQDSIAIGIVDESHAEGVFNIETLTAIHTLSAAIENIQGMIRQDLMSLSTVDNITQGEPGTIYNESYS